MSFWQAKTKIEKQDRLFSQFVRQRDGKCVFGIRCYGKGTADHCCHYFGRAKRSVRFHPDNADAGCRACHLWLDSTAEGKRWHKEFKAEQLGAERLNLLELAAQTPQKRDDFTEILYCQHLLKSLV